MGASSTDAQLTILPVFLYWQEQLVKSDALVSILSRLRGRGLLPRFVIDEVSSPPECTETLKPSSSEIRSSCSRGASLHNLGGMCTCSRSVKPID